LIVGKWLIMIDLKYILPGIMNLYYMFI